MPTKVKIKITDNIDLRMQLDHLYEQASSIQLCVYAIAICDRVLSETSFDTATHEVIQQAVNLNLSWQRGETDIQTVRRACFKIHALAKMNDNIIEKTSLRVLGQAVATAHMREHAMVASDYAIKLCNLRTNCDDTAVGTERLWQIQTLQKALEINTSK